MIQKMSETNLPELSGLPLNIDLFWQKKRSSDIINLLRSEFHFRILRV